VGRGRGLVPRGRNAKLGTDQGRGARSRGSCGEGPGQNVGMGTGVPVLGAECGPGAAVGRGGVRIPGGAAARITGRCKTMRASVRPVPTHGGSRREATWKLGAVGSLRTPRRAIRLARQTHHACSIKQVACNMLRATDMQQKCKCLHARDDSMSAAMHRAVSRLSANATPKPSQGRTNEHTMADSGMSVNLAPEAVVATTSGAGG
jgi:hypothetical protein